MPFLTHSAIGVNELLEDIATPDQGAVILFLGRVRNSNEGRPVRGVEYSAYEAMAEAELERILQEARALHAGVRVALRHRLGYLEVGQVSVALVAAHAHRGPAFEVARYVIEELKRRVPIWKREEYADGTREWVDPTAGIVVS